MLEWWPGPRAAAGAPHPHPLIYFYNPKRGSFPAAHFDQAIRVPATERSFQRRRAPFQRPIFNRQSAFQRRRPPFQRLIFIEQSAFHGQRVPFQRPICIKQSAFQGPRALSSDGGPPSSDPCLSSILLSRDRAPLSSNPFLMTIMLSRAIGNRLARQFPIHA